MVWYFLLAKTGIRTLLNATPRWGVARHRLDGDDTLISSNPSSASNQKARPDGLVFFIGKDRDSNPSDTLS